jgi:type III pantothenate kinase
LQCVSAGVRRQQLAFVKSILDDYPGHRPFITGGDGDWLATALAIRYWPELVFDGLETLCAGYFSR